MPDNAPKSIIPGRPDRLLLLGVARSGTRWLATALGHADATRVVKEPDNVDADPTGTGVSRFGFGPYPMIEPGDDAPQFRALWDLAFSDRVPNKPGLRRTAARAALRLPRGIRDPLMRRTAQAMSALPGRSPHVVVKSIYAHFYVEWLLGYYQPRVVVIQRNPLNTISSWIELGVQGFDLFDRPAVRERYLEPLGISAPPPSASVTQRCAAWVGLLTTVLAGHVDRHPEWLLVTHEELCVDPQVRIREVCDRVGLTWSAEIERFLSESNRPGQGFSHIRVTHEQPTRWRNRLSDQQLDEIEEVLAQFPSRGWIRDSQRLPELASDAH
jgi:Sulfotransferase family